MTKTCDGILKNWAYWLKYVYGFDQYEPEMYAEYDDTADYSDGTLHSLI